jgi:hypothetical protein
MGISVINAAVGSFQVSNAVVSMNMLVNDTTLSAPFKAWQASLGDTGSSGTVTFTTFVPGHAVGTFSATEVPTQGGATGNRSVTSGVFDVRY